MKEKSNFDDINLDDIESLDTGSVVEDYLASSIPVRRKLFRRENNTLIGCGCLLVFGLLLAIGLGFTLRFYGKDRFSSSTIIEELVIIDDDYIPYTGYGGSRDNNENFENNGSEYHVTFAPTPSTSDLSMISGATHESINILSKSPSPSIGISYYGSVFSPITNTYMYIRSLVEPLSGSQVFKSPNSPQNKALNWIFFEDGKQFAKEINEEELIQRYVLSVFYFSMGGENGWTDSDGWLSTDHECSWYGVVCSVRALNQVTQLKLDKNNMQGVIPYEIGYLKYMTTLEFWSNDISGSIPSSIGMMNSLRHVYLDENRITGTLPSEIGNLVNLEDMALFGNYIGGSLPKEVCNLSNLRRLWASKNNLVGTIPKDLSRMSHLVNLYLDDNLLSGRIPNDIGELLFLRDIRINDNRLTGTLPLTIGNLNDLEILYVDDNALSGSIPDSIGRMVSLVDLQLFENVFNGNLPAGMGALKNLEVLHVGRNLLSGILPHSLGNLKNLVSLHLHHNRLSGTIPKEMRKLSRLANMTLQQNELSGSVPLDICNLGLLYLAADCVTKVECQCCTMCW